MHPAHHTKCYCRMGQPPTITIMSAPHTLLIIQDVILGWVNLRPALPCSLCLRRSSGPHTLLTYTKCYCRMGQPPTIASMFSLPPSELWSIHPAHHTKCYCRMGQPHTIAYAPPPSEPRTAQPAHYTKYYSRMNQPFTIPSMSAPPPSEPRSIHPTHHTKC
jgi:hypothetical protein